MAEKFRSTRARGKPFSVLFLEGLKPEELPYEVSEPGGLRIVVGKRTKTFVLRYTSPATGKTRKLTVGRFPAKSLLEARSDLAAARQLIDQGSDPAGLRLAARHAKRTAPTVEELARDYLAWLPAKKSRHEDLYYIARIVKRWGPVRIWAITRRDVLDLRDDQGTKLVTASHLLTHLRKLLSYALDREFIENNPASDVRSMGSFTKRCRFLTDEEIRILWKGTGTMVGLPQPGLMLRLELVTGQRQGEIRLMEKDQLDLASKTWTIPETVAKNKKAHLVPLSELALDVIQSALTESGDSPYVFPGRGGLPLARGTLGQAIRRNAKALPLQDFRPHDLRRTAATGMGSLGVDRLVIQKVLNHTDQTVTAIYDRWLYLAEKREAIDLWAAHLATQICGDDRGVRE